MLIRAAGYSVLKKLSSLFVLQIRAQNTKQALISLNFFIPAPTDKKATGGYTFSNAIRKFGYTCGLKKRAVSEFQLYFGLGKDHILDYAQGYDHILFVVALCAIYQLRDWKQVLILVTAFTIGHSITLALATLNLIPVNVELIEFLIPVTIFITAATNIARKEQSYGGSVVQINYVFALGFGLIHGMGFSNYLRSILGRDENIISQLLAFNLGLEFGQIIIVVIFLLAGFILVDLFGVNRRDWRIAISSAVAGMAILLMKEKVFWLD
jgi:hypothetical protein